MFTSNHFQERDIDRKKMQELAEENARLEFQQKSSFNESANLEEELQRAREHGSNAGLYYVIMLCTSA